MAPLAVCFITHRLRNSRIEVIRPLIPWGLGGRFFEAFCNGRDLLAEHAVDGGAGYQVGLRQLAQGVALLAVSKDGDSIEYQGFPANVPTFELGPPHAGAHPLDDETAFELCDGADDDHDRPA